MLSYSSQAYRSNHHKPIILALCAALAVFCFGYYLGNAEGREEREIIKHVLDSVPPCARSNAQSYSHSKEETTDKRKSF